MSGSRSAAGTSAAPSRSEAGGVGHPQDLESGFFRDLHARPAIVVEARADIGGLVAGYDDRSAVAGPQIDGLRRGARLPWTGNRARRTRSRMCPVDETGHVVRASVDTLPQEAGVTRRGLVVGAGVVAGAILAAGIAGRVLPWREWLSTAGDELSGFGVTVRDYALHSRFVDEPVHYSIAWPPGTCRRRPAPRLLRLAGSRRRAADGLRRSRGETRQERRFAAVRPGRRGRRRLVLARARIR